MAKTDILNIRIEPELKKQVEATLNDLGMNIAEAVTIFLKQVVMTDRNHVTTTKVTTEEGTYRIFMAESTNGNGGIGISAIKIK